MSHFQPSPDATMRWSVARSEFTCELRREGRAAAWIRLGGELDLASAPPFTEALGKALERAQLVIVDLRDLTFMDSSGIHAIIEAESRARRSGQRLVAVRGPAQIQRLFALVGLDSRLEIIDPKSEFAPSRAPTAGECSKVA
jgi:anti-sigma B factor antagonist